MAHTKFKVEVLTPEGEVFNDEVEMVSTRTTLGLIGILAGHAPLLATLEPTELRLYRSESEIVRFAQAEGYLQIAEQQVMLLVEEAIAPEALDVTRLRERISESERELDGVGEDDEKRRLAEVNRRRAEIFLKIAEGG
jgi:F-type H+-transporting ATPase subunit epsilon